MDYVVDVDVDVVVDVVVDVDVEVVVEVDVVVVVVVLVVVGCAAFRTIQSQADPLYAQNEVSTPCAPPSVSR